MARKASEPPVSKMARKPSKRSKAYRIKGTGQKRTTPASTRTAQNQEFRTRRCIGCKNQRDARTYPFCDDCMERTKDDRLIYHEERY